ncbi:MAG TPA: LLM class flavin-dependent oxidoreductase [Rhodopila sp.]|uniref:LLM class flavin-dependent oxidoreductase n=1 Tax=Rhodopila sp. TaxID=2480087 RepID=UPI002BAE0C5F|nr:LLM class flavin-dependent oxidoreductase [Rhodopila sp.]HVY16720.1 LLM class flavin-dependent oxidoreductase [Rhodopila sp.]
MTRAPRMLSLGAFIYPTGHHIAAWRQRDACAEAGVDFEHYVRLARAAERGLFDMMFLADSLAVLPRQGETMAAVSRIAHFGHFEPLTLLSALAARTTHLGLVATVTTTYNEPYHVARKFASLDQISGGRAGWNLVTSASPDEAFNFSRDVHPQHADRYRRARAFAEVVQGLWDSWDDDAFVRDKAGGLFFVPDRMHVLDHHDPYFSVRGPLNVPRSPQGAPVLVQAGSSDDGKDLAAETAEVVFTAHQGVEPARAFYADVKARAARAGRDPDSIRIMPGVFPVIGRTEPEARERYEELQALIAPEVAVTLLSRMTGVDFSPYPIDGPVPALPEVIGGKSRSAMLNALAREQDLTVRQLALRIAGARGHWQIVGTPSQIVDQLEHWFRAGAADGFNVMPPVLPQGLDDFVDHVVPELQRRGLFRTAYAGRTLRAHLGLTPPANGFTRRAPAQR